MVLSLSASEYLGRAESGRSKPMLCMCEDGAGAEYSAYVKYEGFHEDFRRHHLVGELVANFLAVDLKLPAARPALINVHPEFVELLPEHDDCQQLREALAHAPLTAFGSIQIDPVRRWPADGLVRKVQQRDATMLYLFDTLIENTDRGLQNPNLLASGLDFKIIDFGHSFQRCHEDAVGDGGPRPWQRDGIYNHAQGNMQHVMFQSIYPADPQVISDFTMELQALDDQRIESYLTQVPGDWGQDTACKIIDYLIDARNHAGAFETQARRVLT